MVVKQSQKNNMCVAEKAFVLIRCRYRVHDNCAKNILCVACSADLKHLKVFVGRLRDAAVETTTHGAEACPDQPCEETRIDV